MNQLYVSARQEFTVAQSLSGKTSDRCTESHELKLWDSDIFICTKLATIEFNTKRKPFGFGPTPKGGRYSIDYWVGTCRWDSETLRLY